MANNQHSSDGASARVKQGALAKRSIVALMWAGIESWGGQIISLAVYIILARLLGPAEFGLIAMAGVYLAFIKIFVNQGLSVALVQRPELDDSHLNAAFWMSFTMGLALALVSWFVAIPVADIYTEPKLVPVIQALSIALVFASASGVPIALMRRTLKYKPLAVRTLIANSLGGIVAMIMAFNGYGIWSLVAQQLLSGLVKLVLLWVQTQWRPKFSFSFQALTDLLPFSASILGNNLVEFGNRQGDKLIVGIILGPVALGYYVLGYRLYRTMNMLLTGFVSQVSLSSFSALQHNVSKLRNSYLLLTRVAASVAFPCFALAAALAPVFIPQLLGEKWEPSILVFQVLCLVGALECVSFFNGSVMISMGKPHWKFFMGLINFVLNTIGFILVAKLGIVYVAIVYAARSYLVSPLPLMMVKKLIDLRITDYLKGLSVAFFASVGLFIFASEFKLIGWFSDKPLLVTLSTIVIGLVFYGLFVLKCDKVLANNLVQIVNKVRGNSKVKNGVGD